MKFIVPAGVELVSKQEAETLDTTGIWPIGNLYRVISTQQLFRFVPIGGRWNKEFIISFVDNKVMNSNGRPDVYANSFQCTHKRDAVNRLLETTCFD